MLEQLTASVSPEPSGTHASPYLVYWASKGCVEMNHMGDCMVSVKWFYPEFK